MSDAPEALYAARVPIFPRRVSGKFRNLKWVIMAVTLGIYYLTPWIRWDRGPNLPDQAVLVDLANRRFYFFWIEIWPHEFYFVAGLLIMAGLGLFLFTSALGRVWCGYSCPQTVWTDLFILVERWIEGDRNARVRLHTAPWSLKKARLRATKWTTWALIGIATGGAWVFYFADAPTLLGQLLTFSAPPVAYATIAILTATTFIFGGFMREQVCIYMCPWPRIQAAMMDDDTLTVAYRDWRGEPRGKKRVEGVGDCIDCNACVNVCPVGIDIRKGQQMECITCALCIDACDEVMEKIGRDRGLIDYLALSDEPRERAGQPPRPYWHHVLRLRTVLYTLIWALVGVAMTYALFIRPEIEVTVAPVRNPTYVTLSDGTLRNTYELRVRNKHGEARTYGFSVTGNLSLGLTLEGTPYQALEVGPNATQLVRAYVTAPPGSDPATLDRTDFRFWVEDLGNGERAYKDTIFNGNGTQ
ncbi:MAG: cytochrome c oxidase accessory protein CcoG [Pseudomonadota bacterium]